MYTSYIIHDKNMETWQEESQCQCQKDSTSLQWPVQVQLM